VTTGVAGTVGIVEGAAEGVAPAELDAVEGGIEVELLAGGADACWPVPQAAMIAAAAASVSTNRTRRPARYWKRRIGRSPLD
jgi:hypothetical protein